jgi:hypothetical protein
MKLWLLKPVDDNAGPWDPWYDKTFGFVVRAETEERARAVAQGKGGPETYEYNDKYTGRTAVPAWTDPKLSSCVELTADGVEEVVLQDTHAA